MARTYTKLVCRPFRYACRSCDLIKERAEFVRNHRCPDGLDTICKLCWANKYRARRGAPLTDDVSRITYKETRKTPPDPNARYSRADRTEEGRKYRAKYPEKARYRVDIRIARVKRATPPWTQELMAFANQEMLHLVRLREIATGFKWHRDHIVPLAGKTASGLNVPWNIRVIPARVNCAKANRLEI